MIKSLKSPIFLILFTIICLYGTIIAFVISDHIQWFDLPIITFIQSFEGQIITEIMLFFSFIGSASMVIPIALLGVMILFFFFKHRYELLFFVLTLIGSTLLNDGLKLLFKRERPSLHRLIEEVGFSFPSGHSMAAFTLYVTLAYLIWRHINTRKGKVVIIFIALFMILMIGLSRIYLGVHFPSDVIGGYITSALWVYLSISIFKLFKRNVK